MAPPFELSQDQATGVLDLSVDSVTVERHKQVVEEIDVLRHEMISDEGEEALVFNADATPQYAREWGAQNGTYVRVGKARSRGTRPQTR